MCILNLLNLKQFAIRKQTHCEFFIIPILESRAAYVQNAEYFTL